MHGGFKLGYNNMKGSKAKWVNPQNVIMLIIIIIIMGMPTLLHPQ